MSHVGDMAFRLKVATGLHVYPAEDVIVHVSLEWGMRSALHNLINQLESGVDVLILCTRLEIEVVESAHILDRSHIGAVERKIAVVTETGIGDA